MIEYCVICRKKFYDFAWKTYEDGWICSKHFKSSYPEFVPQRIKTQRDEYASSLLQPFRGGEPSKEYIDKYGISKMGITKEQAKKAKPVWKGILPSQWEKSK